MKQMIKRKMNQAMRLALALFCLVAVAMPTTITAQRDNQTYTPAQGTPERQQIIDALRARVERELKQKVVFSFSDNAAFRVQNGWAFLSATPQRRDGKKIDYSKTIYREQVDSGAFDEGIFALLRKRGDTWRIVAYSYGATDVAWLDWDSQYNAPKAIFPQH